MRIVLAYVVTMTVGLAVGGTATAALMDGDDSPAVVTVGRRRSPHTLPPRSPLRGELGVAKIRSDRGLGSVELEARVDGDVGQVDAKAVFELVDDIGRQIVEPEVTSLRFDAGAGTTLRFTSPGLPDGFYAARVTLVAVPRDRRADGSRAIFERATYLEVRDGIVEPLEYERYFSESRAHDGVFAREGAGR